MVMDIIVFLKDWVKSIAIIFVLISIIEIAIPNGNLKKHINMFMGFLIIIVIITPFVNIIDSNYNIEKDIFKNIVKGIETREVYNNEILQTQEKQIKNLYVSKIKKDILEAIGELMHHDVSRLDVSIYEDEANFGSIQHVEIVLKEKKNESINEDKSINVVNIEEITIEKSAEKAKDNLLQDIEQIMGILNDKYNVSKDKITVYLNTMGEGEHSGKNNK